MQRQAVVALMWLFGAGTLRAQYAVADPPLAVHWSLAIGPSSAASSGRTVRLPVPDKCFSCPRIEEVVSGADNGSFHVTLSGAGVPNRVGLALRLEGTFNRNTSEPYIAPPATCVRLKCDQPRKAEVDDAWMLVGALEFAPLDTKSVSAYLTLGGGLGLNRLKWRQDSSTTSELSGTSVAFGPFAVLGGGVRSAFGRWAAFIEWRRFITFVTPGSQMTPLSFGMQFRPKSFGLGA